MPLRWEGVAGKRMRSTDLLFGLELNFVVGPGQHPNSLGGVVVFLRHSIRQAELFAFESGAELFQCERLTECAHNPAGELACQSQFGEFSREQRLFIRGFGIWRGSVRKPLGVNTSIRRSG